MVNEVDNKCSVPKTNKLGKPSYRSAVAARVRMNADEIGK